MRLSRGSSSIERKLDELLQLVLLQGLTQGRELVALHRLLNRTRKIMANLDPIRAELAELQVSAAAATAKLAQLRTDVKAQAAEIARLVAALESAGTDEAAIAQITEELNKVEDDLEAAAADPVPPAE